jgi:hypothetical protein
MEKSKPVLWIPANAPCRNPCYWYDPDSLCRTCIYQFLQEPYCDSVLKSGKRGISQCDGFKLETATDSANALPSYTERNDKCDDCGVSLQELNELNDKEGKQCITFQTLI